MDSPDFAFWLTLTVIVGAALAGLVFGAPIWKSAVAVICATVANFVPSFVFASDSDAARLICTFAGLFIAGAAMGLSKRQIGAVTFGYVATSVAAAFAAERMFHHTSWLP